MKRTLTTFLGGENGLFKACHSLRVYPQAWAGFFVSNKTQNWTSFKADLDDSLSGGVTINVIKDYHGGIVDESRNCSDV